MSFNMASYEAVASTEEDVLKAKQEGMAKAAEKQAKGQEFKVQKTADFKRAAQKAAKKFGNLKSIGMAVGLGLAAMTGVGAIAAGVMGGGGALLGGLAGKKAAKNELAGQDYFKGTQEGFKDSMDKSIAIDTIMGAVMGGIGGSGNVAGSGVKANVGNFAKSMFDPTKAAIMGGSKTLLDQVKNEDEFGATHL